jgi:5-methylcytosine-specific restriction endonuclease McrA
MNRPRVCGTPGCPWPAAPGTGRCPTHARPPWQGAGGRHGGSDWTYRTLTRPAVLARDGHQCVDCGATGVELEVDHLDRLATGAPLQAPMHRMQTVCVPCHRRREQARNTEARKGTSQPPEPGQAR